MATESGADNQKKKKPNIAIRIGGWFKAAALELKKTSWPKGREVFKKLGIVVVVVLFFFLVLMAMDIVLNELYQYLMGNVDHPFQGFATATGVNFIMSIFKPGLAG